MSSEWNDFLTGKGKKNSLYGQHELPGRIRIMGEDGGPPLSLEQIGFAKKKLSEYLRVIEENRLTMGKKQIQMADGTLIFIKENEGNTLIDIRVPNPKKPSPKKVPHIIEGIEDYDDELVGIWGEVLLNQFAWTWYPIHPGLFATLQLVGYLAALPKEKDSSFYELDYYSKEKDPIPITFEGESIPSDDYGDAIWVEPNLGYMMLRVTDEKPYLDLGTVQRTEDPLRTFEEESTVQKLVEEEEEILQLERISTLEGFVIFAD